MVNEKLYPRFLVHFYVGGTKIVKIFTEPQDALHYLKDLNSVSVGEDAFMTFGYVPYEKDLALVNTKE